jgi:thiosulfate/3-mercaptopyruvate sulfurtransferase
MEVKAYLRTRTGIKTRRFWVIVGALLSVSSLLLPLVRAQSSNSSNNLATNLATAQLLSPADLVAILQSAKQAKPLVLNIGPRMLYAQAHIPGSEYIGPGSDPQAIQKLRDRVTPLPRNTFIVLYCGCCPWVHCPNVFPAYKEMSKLGFTRVKVLYIADNFGADWVYKGYPTARD